MTNPRTLTVAVVAACPLPQPRGTPVRILRLSEAVAARGHEVHVITYHLGDGDLPESLRVHRIPRIPTYRKRTPGPSVQKLLLLDPLLAAKLSSVLRQRKFDVIHAHHYEGLIAAAVGAAGAGVPVVYDAHTCLETELPSYRLFLPRGVKRRLGRYLDRWLPGSADHVIAVTERIRRRLIETGIPEDRVTVASQGIEDPFFRAPEEESGEEAAAVAEPGGTGAARQSAASADGPPVVIYAGNLAPYQGIELLLAAFADVHSQRPDSRLRILTRSSFEPYRELARRVGVEGAIDLAPTIVEELPARLREAAVAVNPRIQCDGIPIKLLNYMAAARPVVSFEGSAPILRDGETARLVPDGDTTAFGRAIIELLDEPERAREMGRRARREAELNHRWDGIAARVEAVYRRLLRPEPATVDAATPATPATER